MDSKDKNLQSTVLHAIEKFNSLDDSSEPTGDIPRFLWLPAMTLLVLGILLILWQAWWIPVLAIVAVLLWNVIAKLSFEDPKTIDLFDISIYDIEYYFHMLSKSTRAVVVAFPVFVTLLFLPELQTPVLAWSLAVILLWPLRILAGYIKALPEKGVDPDYAALFASSLLGIVCLVWAAQYQWSIERVANITTVEQKSEKNLTSPTVPVGEKEENEGKTSGAADSEEITLTKEQLQQLLEFSQEIEKWKVWQQQQQQKQQQLQQSLNKLTKLADKEQQSPTVPDDLLGEIIQKVSEVTQKQIAEQEQKLQELREQLTSLEKQLQSQKLPQVDSLMAQLRKELQQEQQGLVFVQELQQKFESQIQTLESRNQQLQAQIEELEAKNQELEQQQPAQDIAQLQLRNQDLQDKIAKLEKTNSNLRSIQEMQHEMQQLLEEENKELKSKIQELKQQLQEQQSSQVAPEEEEQQDSSQEQQDSSQEQQDSSQEQQDSSQEQQDSSQEQQDSNSATSATGNSSQEPQKETESPSGQDVEEKPDAGNEDGK